MYLCIIDYEYVRMCVCVRVFVCEHTYICSHCEPCNTAVQSEKGLSFGAIKNFHFEKNKKMYFGVFLKHYLRYIMLNNMKF